MSAELIHRLYAALGKRDAEAMAACYTDDAYFRDPVFELPNAGVRDMWRMLAARGKDLAVEVSGVSSDGATGKAHWDASYTFSQTGRKVLNRIDAAFKFRDGLICHHIDTFDLWRWSRQALGVPGVLLGWSPFLQAKIRRNAAAGLAAFTAKSR
jgi:ketosteroid isomerase-like protein